MDSQQDSEGGSQPSQGSSVMTATPEARREILYFAYGSNLSTDQMRRRCPHSTPVGLAWLPGWRWTINERGYANVVPPAEQLQQHGGDGAGRAGVAARVTTQSPGQDRDGAEFDGVYGLLYLLPPQDEAQLDRFEGVPWAYEKMRCQVRWVRDGDGRPVCGDALEEEGDDDGGGDGGARRGRPVSALVYVDRERTGQGPPRQEYVGRMETAIADAVANWGLPEDYADRVMRKALVGKRAKGKGASKGTAR